MKKYLVFFLALSATVVMAGDFRNVSVERSGALTNLTAEGETVVAEQADGLFYLDGAELEDGYVYLVQEAEMDPSREYVAVTRDELRSILGGTNVVAFGLYYHSSHGWIVRMNNCNASCSQNISVHNIGSTSQNVFVAKSFGSFGLSGGTIGSTFTLYPNQSASYTLSATMPSGPFGPQARYWDGALIISGLTSPGSSYFNVCLSQNSTYCN